jgi:hypothetical protein
MLPHVDQMETMQHLIMACLFSQQVWYETVSWLTMTCRPPDRHSMLADWWLKANQATPKPLGKGLATISRR